VIALRGGAVKNALLLAVILWAVPSFAQTQTQMVCRDLKESGGFLYAGETVVNGQACRQVTYAPAQQAVLVNTSAPVAGPAPVPTTAAPAQPVAEPVAPPAPKINDGKVRLFVTDEPNDESIFIASHRSGWQVHGSSSGQVSGSFVNGTGSVNGSSSGYVSGSGGSSGAAFGYSQKGGDPRTVEVEADLYKKCPSIVVTNDPARADYVLLFRRQGGKRSSMFAFGGLTGLAISANAKVDGASVFDTNGDMAYATRARTVETAIKEVCGHLK
jgi:hypothetical protein